MGRPYAARISKGRGTGINPRLPSELEAVPKEEKDEEATAGRGTAGACTCTGAVPGEEKKKKLTHHLAEAQLEHAHARAVACLLWA